MSKLSFILQYITKPRTVGAILPSSKYLAAKMVKDIDFANAKCIAEYGAGTGVFTRQLVQKRNPNTVLLIFEMNESFCHALKQQFANQPNLHIINDSAAKIGEYLAKFNQPHADYVISGLPFASIPQEISINILKQTQKYIKKEGKFITFQYTLLKKDFIGQFFDSIKITREFRNVPPAYVLCCANPFIPGQPLL